MFDSALELISEAASNSLFIFCCCNLIIVMILMGSKPSSTFERGRESSISVVTNAYANGIQTRGINSMHSVDGNKSLMDVKEVSSVQEAPADEDNEETSCANDNNEDDEFRRRVEAFIDKVNSGWKAELLRTSHLV